MISGSTVITSGKANAMLSASLNIVLCCYINQITACSLYIKKVDAYEKYVSLSTEHPVLSMTLLEKRQSCHPMFKFWNLILNVEIPDKVKKIKLNFYFHTSLWCLKRFYKGLKGLHKTFWGTTKKSENKNLTQFFISILLSEMNGSLRVNSTNWVVTFWIREVNPKW